MSISAETRISALIGADWVLAPPWISCALTPAAPAAASARASSVSFFLMKPPEMMFSTYAALGSVSAGQPDGSGTESIMKYLGILKARHRSALRQGHDKVKFPS